MLDCYGVHWNGEHRSGLDTSSGIVWAWRVVAIAAVRSVKSTICTEVAPFFTYRVFFGASDYHGEPTPIR